MNKSASELFSVAEGIPMAFVQNLHSGHCQQSDEDLETMAAKLGRDPDALDRRAEFSFCGQLTPLQSAVYRNHPLCVQFLLDVRFYLHLKYLPNA